jgi:hypothetical protein
VAAERHNEQTSEAGAGQVEGQLHGAVAVCDGAASSSRPSEGGVATGGVQPGFILSDSWPIPSPRLGTQTLVHRLGVEAPRLMICSL